MGVFEKRCCPRGQQAAAMALRAACSEIQNNRHTHTHTLSLLPVSCVPPQHSPSFPPLLPLLSPSSSFLRLLPLLSPSLLSSFPLHYPSESFPVCARYTCHVLPLPCHARSAVAGTIRTVDAVVTMASGLSESPIMCFCCSRVGNLLMPSAMPMKCTLRERSRRRRLYSLNRCCQFAILPCASLSTPTNRVFSASWSV